MSQGHAALDRGTPKHQHPQDESAEYVKSGTPQVDVSRLDPGNRGGGNSHASREGAAGNAEGVAGDSKNPGGGKGGVEEARSPNIVGAVKQPLGVRTKPGEVEQNSGGGQGVTGTATLRSDFHTSSFKLRSRSSGMGRDALSQKKSPKDDDRHLPSNSQRKNDPKSPSDRVYEREANKTKEVTDMRYEPD